MNLHEATEDINHDSGLKCKITIALEHQTYSQLCTKLYLYAACITMLLNVSQIQQYYNLGKHLNRCVHSNYDRLAQACKQ